MNGRQLLDSDDAVLIIKAFVLEKLNAYEPRVVDVEAWNPVLFARYQDKHGHSFKSFKRSYITLAKNFRNWLEHGKNIPGHLIERLMVSLEGDEEDLQQWFLGQMVLYGPNPESNGTAEEEGRMVLYGPNPESNGTAEEEGRMVLYVPNPESNGTAEEEGDQGGWLLDHVPAPPAINAAPSDDGWEILELPAASDDYCM
jgi:hypothetical protein